MSSNLNWVGNRVLDPSSTRQKMNSPYTMPIDPSVNYSAQNYTIPQDFEMEAQGPTTTPQQRGGMDQMPPGVTQPGMPQQEITQQGPPPSTEEGYIPHYLASNIGRNVRAEFIIGTTQYVDKVGRLIEVGINYFVLDDVNSRTHIMCDLYSVKFVTVLQE